MIADAGIPCPLWHEMHAASAAWRRRIEDRLRLAFVCHVQNEGRRWNRQKSERSVKPWHFQTSACRKWRVRIWLDCTISFHYPICWHRKNRPIAHCRTSWAFDAVLTCLLRKHRRTHVVVSKFEAKSNQTSSCSRNSTRSVTTSIFNRWRMLITADVAVRLQHGNIWARFPLLHDPFASST